MTMRSNLNKLAPVIALVGVVGIAIVLRAGGATAGSSGAPQAADAAEPPAAEAAAGADAHTEATYPVVLVSPEPHVFKRLIHAFGVISADLRATHTISMATVGIVRSVEVVPGESVKTGQLLFRVEADPLARLAYRQASSALTLARAEVARLAAQRAEHLATATQLETAEKAVIDAEAGVDAARRQGASADAELIRASTDGIVTTLSVATGDRPATGTALAVIAPIASARARLGVEPGDAPRIQVGMRVNLRSIHHDGATRTGKVVMAGASIDKDTHLVNVVVATDQPTFGGWLVGEAVEATIAIESVDAFAVPRAAVVKGEDGTGVFEVVDGKAHRVPVAIEVDEGARLGVTGALDKGRRIVTTGAAELEDGGTVAEQKP